MSFIKRSLSKYNLDDQKLNIDKVIEVISIIDMITYCKIFMNDFIVLDNDTILINKITNIIYTKYIFNENILRMISNLVKVLIIQICKNGDKRLTDEKLILISKYFPEIEILNVSWNNNITDTGLKKFKNLKYLNAGLCQNISDNGLVNMKQLQELYIQNNKNITGIHFKKMKQLKILDISCCTSINPCNIYKMDFCILSVCWNCSIDDNCIKNIKSIEYLNISGNEKITNIGIKTKLNKLKLVTVSIGNKITCCPNILKCE